MDSLKVVLVDDSDEYAASVKAWLAVFPELHLIGVASGGEQGCSLVERVRPDLVLMDVSMPDLNGFEATRRIKSLNNPPKVLILTIDDSRAVREAARDAGADAFVGKTELTTALLPSIRRLFAGAPARRAPEHHDAHFRRLIEHTPDVIALIDTEDTFTYVSPAVERWLGYRSAECVGIKVLDLVHPADRPHIEALLAPQGTDRAGCFVEARVRHRDGTWRTMESACAEHTGEDGIPFRVVTARDLTQRRRIEHHLRITQNNEVIGRMAGSLAHDFNNILMVILNNADILALRSSPGDPKHAYVEAIRDGVTRGTGLARQLIAFSRQQQFQPKLFDVNTTIEGMTPQFQRLVGSGIRVVTRLSPDAASITADPTQIERVVLNLIVNAGDAMPRGGQLTIETDAVGTPTTEAGVVLEPGDYLRLSVTDTGCGMNAEIQSRIFDPLFTTKEAGHGTGLGLATVQGIVARHGGIIEVDSAEGRGSTFRIFLPRGDTRALGRRVS